MTLKRDEEESSSEQIRKRTRAKKMREKSCGTRDERGRGERG